MQSVPRPFTISNAHSMLISRPLRAAAIALVVGSVLSACRRPVPPGAIPVADTTTTATVFTPPSDSGANAANRDASLADETARAEAERRNALLAPVYFEFDQADLSDQTRAALEQKAALLRESSAISMRIAGHTDSRGSDEYNLALGQRRGAVVKRYLMERGIAESRLEVVSFGEERPAADGDDEAARSQSRRAEFEITSGGTPTQPSSPSQASP